MRPILLRCAALTVGLATIFELPHHMPKARVEACAGGDGALCVSVVASGGVMQAVRDGVEQSGEQTVELEQFPCAELSRVVGCTLPSRRAHAGRNCFNSRPAGDSLRPAWLEGGGGPGNREWDWQAGVGVYLDAHPATKYRWRQAPLWASLWSVLSLWVAPCFTQSRVARRHKPWSKVKLTLENKARPITCHAISP
jgi:hypothetical protein